MINVGFLLGYPVDFKHICMVYPPKVKDVVTNQNYNIYSRLLTFSQEEIEDEYVKAQLDLKELLSPFEYKISSGSRYETGFRQKEQALWSSVTVRRILENEVYIGNLA